MMRGDLFPAPIENARRVCARRSAVLSFLFSFLSKLTGLLYYRAGAGLFATISAASRGANELTTMGFIEPEFARLAGKEAP